MNATLGPKMRQFQYKGEITVPRDVRCVRDSMDRPVVFQGLRQGLSMIQVHKDDVMRLLRVNKLAIKDE